MNKNDILKIYKYINNYVYIMKYYKYRSIIISHNNPNLHRLDSHSQHKKTIAEFKSAQYSPNPAQTEPGLS